MCIIGHRPYYLYLAKFSKTIHSLIFSPGINNIFYFILYTFFSTSFYKLRASCKSLYFALSEFDQLHIHGETIAI